MIKDLISVIVPVYKTEQFLERCLDSIINQTYKNIEIICVNDGTPDNSQEILEKYAKKDKRIKIINQSNLGLANARNNALLHANGDWLTFVDSDDYILPNTYELALSKSQNVDMVYWGVSVEKANSNDDIPWLYGMRKHFTLKYKGEKEYSFDVARKTSVVVWNKLYRHKIIKDNNIMFPSVKTYEDEGFFWKFFPYCDKVYFIEEKNYIYLLRKNSIMGTEYIRQKSYYENQYDLIKDIFEFYKRNNLVNKYKDTLNYIFKKYLTEYSSKVNLEEYYKLLDKAKLLYKDLGIKPTQEIKKLFNGQKNIFIEIDTTSLLEKIFSVVNEDGYKILYILFHKIKLKKLPK